MLWLLQFLAQAVGWIVLVRFLIQAAMSIAQNVYALFLNDINLKKQYGPWAVVTGATDGIGKAYAIELAKRGMSVMVIGRNRDKLQTAVNDIRMSTKKEIEVKAIEFDFDKDSGAYDELASQLGGLDVGVLVNNAGVTYDRPDDFLSLPQQKIDSMIRVNIVHVNQMLRLILPGMVQRKRGAIVNISSGSATHPTPLLAVYAATKAYVDFLSHALAVEYASTGVIIQNVLPFYVSTKLSGAKPSILSPTPRTYVRQALNTLGALRKTHGFWTHVFQGWVASALPCRVMDQITYKFNDHTRAQKALEDAHQPMRPKVE